MEVNEAIILAYRQGILTSTSLMVAGRAYEHAVALAKDNPGLAVGLHVTCADGYPVMHPSEIPRVVGKNGAFPSDPALAGLRYFFCRSAKRELFKEVAAQFEKFSRSGLDFSHVDSHCHLHVHPVVLDTIVDLSEMYGIKRVRVPSDCFFTALPFLSSPGLSAGYAIVFKLLTAWMKSKLRRRGFIFPARVYGNFLTGGMTLEYVLSLLNSLPGGYSEIYFHPALPSSPSKNNEVRLQQFRELSILLNPDVRSKLDFFGIILSTYFDLDKHL